LEIDLVDEVVAPCHGLLPAFYHILTDVVEVLDGGGIT